MSSVPRIFLPSDSLSGDTACITGSDALHIGKVLRLRVGDKVTVCDMKNTEYIAEITDVGKNAITVALGAGRATDVEMPFDVTVYQGVTKGDKFETVVQKSVELGATVIVPVLCERCVSRPEGSSLVSKTERYNKIAASAASQCGRGVMPQVKRQIDFSQALSEMKNSDCSFVCYEGDGTVPIKTLLSGMSAKSISFLIGPEGGFSTAEIEAARRAGISLCGLGKRILRTETAALFALSAISVLLE